MPDLTVAETTCFLHQYSEKSINSEQKKPVGLFLNKVYSTYREMY